MTNEYIPDKDASLGLIFRLNNLWAEIDLVSSNGKYDIWNYKLDCIYRNLSFREPMVPEVDKVTGKIINVLVSEKDLKIYRYLSMEVARTRMASLRNRNPKLKYQKRSEWYYAIQKKDMYLRKFMQVLKLYLKETEQTPGNTMYGISKKRRQR